MTGATVLRPTMAMVYMLSSTSLWQEEMSASDVDYLTRGSHSSRLHHLGAEPQHVAGMDLGDRDREQAAGPLGEALRLRVDLRELGSPYVAASISRILAHASERRVCELVIAYSYQVQEFDTNVFQVTLDCLENKGEIATGDAEICKQCAGVFSKLSKLSIE